MARRLTERARKKDNHGQESLRQSLGPPHRADVAWGRDATPHRAPPDPRGHEPAGVRHAARSRAHGAMPERTFATVDHIIPTDNRRRPFQDPLAEGMVKALRMPARSSASRSSTSRLASKGSSTSSAPSWSHAARHHRWRAAIRTPRRTARLAPSRWGSGRRRCATYSPRSASRSRLKVRRIEVTGKLGPGVYAKDIISTSSAGSACSAAPATPTSTRARPSKALDGGADDLCNMSIEGGARVGYVIPTRKRSTT